MLNEQIEHVKNELETLNTERDREIKKVQDEYNKRTQDLSRNLAQLEKQRRTNFLSDYLQCAFEAVKADKNAFLFLPHDYYTKEYELAYPDDPILGIGNVTKILLQFQSYEIDPNNPDIPGAPYGAGPKLILWVERYLPFTKRKEWHSRLIHSFDADPSKISRKELRKIVSDDLKKLSEKKFKTIPGSWQKF